MVKKYPKDKDRDRDSNSDSDINKNKDKDKTRNTSVDSSMNHISELFRRDMHNIPLGVAVKIAGIYMLIGMLWILFSDRILMVSVSDKQTIEFISTIKGWVYVLLSAIIIFLLVFSSLKKIRVAELELRKNSKELIGLYEQLEVSKEKLDQQLKILTYSEDRLRTSEERFRLAAEGSNSSIWDIDLLENKYYFSDRWFDFLGFEQVIKEYPFENWQERLLPEDEEKVNFARDQHLEGKTPFYSCEYRLRCENGEYKWFYSRGKALLNNEGKAIRIAGSLSDIHDRKQNELKLKESYRELDVTYTKLFQAQEELKKQNIELREYQKKLRYNAYHDSLTGLPNRLSLYESLSNYIAENPDRQVALLFIDADNFKFINDTMGHEFGNQLIVHLGNNLTNLSEKHHGIYRIGGDEFIYCCYGFSQIQEIEEYAERIMRNLELPFEISNSTLHLTVSIGISTYPQDGNTVDSLMQCADIAMYRAKALGKNNFVCYNATMQGYVTERMIIEKHLRNALQNNEFQIYYQPQIDIQTHRITGFEALIRWNNAELGFVSPIEFIGISEETHLIIPIGEWVLRNACLFIKQLLVKGYTELTVSVNVSIIQLLQQDFVEIVQRTLAFMNIDPTLLELEITESIMMESFDTLGDKLNKLKELGVKIALDDFGKGYSSLNYLKQLPIDTLKIDKTFIDDINTVKDNDSITDMIVRIGRKMGMTVLAEGVETQEQYDYLAKNSCHKIQGYFISKPIPQDEVIKFYEEWK